MPFNRGDRVEIIDTPGTVQGMAWNGQTGTITHLPGDPPDVDNPDGFSPESGYYWISWDNRAITDAWVQIENLQLI